MPCKHAGCPWKGTQGTTSHARDSVSSKGRHILQECPLSCMNISPHAIVIPCFCCSRGWILRHACTYDCQKRE